MMRNTLFILGFLMAFVACKQEEPAARMAKDLCGCLAPIVEAGEGSQEIIERGSEAEIAAWETKMQKASESASKCFVTLESRHGSMMDHKDDVIIHMRTRCPEAVRYVSGEGGTPTEAPQQ